MNEPESMFKLGDKIRHVKTGQVYSITETPLQHLRLEASNSMFYAYMGSTGIVWYRSIEEMEDGRFIKCEVIE
jgi:hypothetical protein